MKVTQVSIGPPDASDTVPRKIEITIQSSNTKIHNTSQFIGNTGDSIVEMTSTYESDDSGSISMVLSESKKNIAKLILPFQWFPPNSVVHECFPMQPLVEMQHIPLVFMTIHRNDNNSQEYKAPLSIIKPRLDVIAKTEFQDFIPMNLYSTPIHVTNQSTYNSHKSEYPRENSSENEGFSQLQEDTPEQSLSVHDKSSESLPIGAPLYNSDAPKFSGSQVAMKSREIVQDESSDENQSSDSDSQFNDDLNEDDNLKKDINLKEEAEFIPPHEESDEFLSDASYKSANHEFSLKSDDATAHEQQEILGMPISNVQNDALLSESSDDSFSKIPDELFESSKPMDPPPKQEEPNSTFVPPVYDPSVRSSYPELDNIDAPINTYVETQSPYLDLASETFQQHEDVPEAIPNPQPQVQPQFYEKKINGLKILDDFSFYPTPQQRSSYYIPPPCLPIVIRPPAF